MRKNKGKALLAATMAGAVFGGGCLDGIWGRILLDAALSAGYEFIWDNDSVLDLFEDDGNNVQGE